MNNITVLLSSTALTIATLIAIVYINIGDTLSPFISLVITIFLLLIYMGAIYLAREKILKNNEQVLLQCVRDIEVDYARIDPMYHEIDKSIDTAIRTAHLPTVDSANDILTCEMCGDYTRRYELHQFNVTHMQKETTNLNTRNLLNNQAVCPRCEHTLIHNYEPQGYTTNAIQFRKIEPTEPRHAVINQLLTKKTLVPEINATILANINNAMVAVLESLRQTEKTAYCTRQNVSLIPNNKTPEQKQAHLERMYRDASSNMKPEHNSGLDVLKQLTDTQQAVVGTAITHLTKGGRNRNEEYKD